MRNKDKIIRILSLLSTDKREEVVRAYIEYIIGSGLNVNSVQKIIDSTQANFGILLQAEEVDAELSWLKSNGRITTSSNKLQLADYVKEEAEKQIALDKKQRDERFKLFQVDIQNINKGKLSDEIIFALYQRFEEYLYDCFLEYGREATKIFAGNGISDEQSTKAYSFMQATLSKVKNSAQRELLGSYIENSSNNLTVKQADYLEELANKAESFFALGLPKELHNEFLNVVPLGWTIFLDTNVLYSILKLHSHGENEAVRAIVSMSNKFADIFKIEFKYLAATYKELRLLKPELERNIINVNLTQKQIQAALASNKLDGYAKSYYENMLEDGSNTLHPARVIDTAVTALKFKNIEIYNRQLYQEGEEPAEFVDKISAYNTYQQIRNEARVERGLEYKVKSVDRIEHDVTLREMVLLLRENENFVVHSSVTECKVYGLTIDNALVDFDNYERRKPGNKMGDLVPTFFFPSYLLKRMCRYLPVQSDDYKKSFISSISSPFLPSSTEDSNRVQKTLAHFHSMGVDDSDFMISRLADEIFVQTVNTLETKDEVEAFIESDINKLIDAKSKEIESSKRQINAIEGKLESSVMKTNAVTDENDSLRTDKTTLEQHVHSLTVAIDKLNSQVRKNRKSVLLPKNWTH